MIVFVLNLFRFDKVINLCEFFLFFLNVGNDLMFLMDINEWILLLLCVDGCVMIVFDVIWKYVKEMVSVSFLFLLKFVICVCFDCDVKVGGGSIYDLEFILRKEFFKGCMSIMEVVVRVLRVFEFGGIEIEEKLVDVLRLMVFL